ncbi:MAG: hypothetical protein WC860_09835, partial [Candidatus Margulisiibacteriota bacterium]
KINTIAILYSTNNEIVKQIINYKIRKNYYYSNINWDVYPPDNSQYNFSGKILLDDYGRRFQLLQFDIDNDGASEDVIVYYSRNQYRDGDVYFIYPTKQSPDFSKYYNLDDGKILVKLSQSAKKIFPHSWLKKKIDLENDDYDFKVKINAWWEDYQNRSSGFMLRYCYFGHLFFRDKHILWLVQLAHYIGMPY